ncbi:unnamed protein product [Paramecium pentaurelia]|uniref:Uncharacterized protein n=1 Tax=Paramecium pentaurelia TaxID=43138 RepID=A0A8S1T2W2_9CILI|nr:unnamed protein product [Paramecium pentaurelia]
MNNERIHIDYLYKPLYEYTKFTELQNHLSYLISKKILKQFSLPNSNINIGPPIKYEKMIKYNKFQKLCN